MVRGIVKHGFEVLVPSWMMDRAELAIYESPDAFIRSAKPYADHGPRLGHRVASFKLPANARTSENIRPRSSRFSPTQRTSALPVIAPSAPAANTA